jgi:hypothetical protein
MKHKIETMMQLEFDTPIQAGQEIGSFVTAASIGISSAIWDKQSAHGLIISLAITTLSASLRREIGIERAIFFLDQLKEGLLTTNPNEFHPIATETKQSSYFDNHWSSCAAHVGLACTCATGGMKS